MMHWMTIHPSINEITLLLYYSCMCHASRDNWIAAFFFALWFNNSLHENGQNGVVFLHFSYTLTHLFIACKWPKWCNIFLYFSCTMIHQQMAKTMQSFCIFPTICFTNSRSKWCSLEVVYLATTSKWWRMTWLHYFKGRFGFDFMQNGWWDGGLVQWFQSHETCHDFTICFLNIIL